MVNSELAKDIVGQGVFEPGAVKITIDEVIPGQPHAAKALSAPGRRRGFWRQYEKHGFEGAARYVGAYGFVKTVKTLVKRLMGRV